VWIISIYRYWGDIWFLAKYFKFVFGKISADLNSTYKIAKFFIASSNPTNFQSFQISSSDNQPKNPALVKS